MLDLSPPVVNFYRVGIILAVLGCSDLILPAVFVPIFETDVYCPKK